MKTTRLAGVAGLCALALTLIGTGSASATTLEVGGVTKNASVELSGTLVTFTDAILKDTAGFSKNECSISQFSGRTEFLYTGSSVTGWMGSLTFTGCTRPVTVDNAGSIEITYTSGTNGSVASEGAQFTVGSAIGTMDCRTGITTNLGTLTGTASGQAIIDVNAVLNCGIIPSAKWEGTYKILSPSGLGVSS